jgi:hypothetical protein
VLVLNKMHIKNPLSSKSIPANGREIQRLINNHIEASQIGRQIAEQVLDYQRRMGDVSSGNEKYLTLKVFNVTSC